jgi:hypothetical protein
MKLGGINAIELLTALILLNRKLGRVTRLNDRKLRSNHSCHLVGVTEGKHTNSAYKDLGASD